MAKEVITATVDTDTVTSVHKYAGENDRSFSASVNILLKKALEMIKRESDKNK